jgi:putative transcriptional regulator
VSDSLQGSLLIAAANLLDPNFARTVVLVTEHGEEGAMGIVLNRPSPITVRDGVPPLAELADADEPIYVGGPVEPEAVVVLAELEDPEEAALLVFGNVGFLRADADLELVLPAVTRARVFAGYAGWSPGQLEAELAEESWIVEPVEAEDVFSAEPDALWSAVLERKGGPFALLARMPLDPSVN